MTNLVQRLRAKADRFFSVRERVGYKQKVFLLTRTWQGPRVGVGSPVDAVVRIKPAPGIRDLSHRRQVTTHGQTIEGDIVLTGIAFNNYNEELLGNTTNTPLTEKFYLIDGKTYSVANVSQKFVSWEVVLKKANKSLWRDSIIPND